MFNLFWNNSLQKCESLIHSIVSHFLRDSKILNFASHSFAKVTNDEFPFFLKSLSVSEHILFIIHRNVTELIELLFSLSIIRSENYLSLWFIYHFQLFYFFHSFFKYFDYLQTDHVFCLYCVFRWEMASDRWYSFLRCCYTVSITVIIDFYRIYYPLHLLHCKDTERKT